MRQSQFFAPTLRQAKADNAGHALLLRGAFVRQLTSGIYSYLPLGLRVLAARREKEPGANQILNLVFKSI